MGTQTSRAFGARWRRVITGPRSKICDAGWISLVALVAKFPVKSTEFSSADVIYSMESQKNHVWHTYAILRLQSL